MGRLLARLRKNKESASFEYDGAWLRGSRANNAAGRPSARPRPVTHMPADAPMFGAIDDSARRTGGDVLSMRRMERLRRAEREGTAPHTLQEIDFLLLVDDEARQGALRFAEQEGRPFSTRGGRQAHPAGGRTP